MDVSVVWLSVKWEHVVPTGLSAFLIRHKVAKKTPPLLHPRFWCHISRWAVCWGQCCWLCRIINKNEFEAPTKLTKLKILKWNWMSRKPSGSDVHADIMTFKSLMSAHSRTMMEEMIIITNRRHPELHDNTSTRTEEGSEPESRITW